MSRRNATRRQRLAAALRDARLRARLTQKEVQQKTGIAQTVVSKLEKGGHKIDALDFALLADAVGLDPGLVLEIARNPAFADPPQPRPSHLVGPRKGAPRDR